MTKVSLQKNKDEYLKKNFKNIKKQKLKNKLTLLIFFLIFSCSNIVNKEESLYETPEKFKDKFPFSTIKKTCEDDLPCYVIELKPESLSLECSLRNDSPYYWCHVSGVLKNPDPKLPKKISTVFHSVVGPEAKTRSEKFVIRLKKSKKPVYLITINGYFISQDKELISQLTGLFNEDECIEIYNDYSACRESKKKFNIHSGKYI
jgi:hypothetical protein